MGNRTLSLYDQSAGRHSPRTSPWMQLIAHSMSTWVNIMANLTFMHGNIDLMLNAQLLQNFNRNPSPSEVRSGKLHLGQLQLRLVLLLLHLMQVHPTHVQFPLELHAGSNGNYPIQKSSLKGRLTSHLTQLAQLHTGNRNSIASPA